MSEGTPRAVMALLVCASVGQSVPASVLSDRLAGRCSAILTLEEHQDPILGPRPLWRPTEEGYRRIAALPFRAYGVLYGEGLGILRAIGKGLATIDGSGRVVTEPGYFYVPMSPSTGDRLRRTYGVATLRAGGVDVG